MVRVSAAVGLPRGWPDIQGVALRLSDLDADVLFASTGLGGVSRHLLRFVRADTSHVVTTLLPYRAPCGPIVLALAPVAPRRHALLYAAGRGPWLAFGRLELAEQIDEELSFDPVERTLPGLENFRWVELLRSPAYRTARARRGEPVA